ncbi:hypothetical protein FRC17_000018 [Serendipita sp. 399]|nr:hypothetical protein FRC17_000018 [Serendipita sp. 399]
MSNHLTSSKDSGQPHLVHQALLLVAALVPWSSESLVHHIMPILLSTGSYISPRDDAYSARVAEKRHASISYIPTTDVLETKRAANSRPALSGDLCRFSDKYTLPQADQAVLGFADFLNPICILLLEETHSPSEGKKIQAERFKLAVSLLESQKAESHMALISDLLEDVLANIGPQWEETINLLSSLRGDSSEQHVHSTRISRVVELVNHSISHWSGSKRFGTGEHAQRLLSALTRLLAAFDGTIPLDHPETLHSLLKSTTSNALRMLSASTMLFTCLQLLRSNDVALQVEMFEILASRLPDVESRTRDTMSPDLVLLVKIIQNTINSPGNTKLIINALRTLQVISLSARPSELVAVTQLVPTVVNHISTAELAPSAIETLNPICTAIGPRVVPYLANIVETCSILLRNPDVLPKARIVAVRLLRSLIDSTSPFWTVKDVEQLVLACVFVEGIQSTGGAEGVKSLGKHASGSRLLSRHILFTALRNTQDSLGNSHSSVHEELFSLLTWSVKSARQADIENESRMLLSMMMAAWDNQKALITPYLAILITRAIEVLDLWSQAPMRFEHSELWKALLDIIEQSAHVDNGALWSDELAHSASAMLVRQMSIVAISHKQWMLTLLCSAMSSVASVITDPTLLKTLNLDILMQTRSEQTETRLLSLNCLEKLWTSNGRRLVGWRNEAMPFLHECAEDENEDVAAESRRIKLILDQFDSAKTSTDSIGSLEKWIKDLNVPERKTLVMKAINATTIALGHVQKSGWTSGAPITQYSEDSVENTIQAGEISLASLRTMKSGANVEKAALNFIGKLLALRLYHVAWRLLPPTKVGIYALLYGSQSAVPNGDDTYALPHPSIELMQDADVILVVVTYLSYEVHALLHEELPLITRILWDMVSETSSATKGYLLSWLTAVSTSDMATKALPLCTSLLKAVEVSHKHLDPQLSALLRVYMVQCVLAVASEEEYKWIWKQARNITKDLVRSKTALSSCCRVFDQALMSCVDIARSRHVVAEFETDHTFKGLLDEWRKLPSSDRDNSVLQYLGTPIVSPTTEQQVTTSMLTSRASKLSICLTENPQEFATSVMTWSTDLQRWASDLRVGDKSDWTEFFNGLEKFRRQFRRVYESTIPERIVVVVLTNFADTYEKLHQTSPQMSLALISATIESRILLSKLILKPLDIQTYDRSRRELIMSSLLLENFCSNTEPTKCRVLQQCLSGAFWNLGSSLYQAGHWDHAVSFISEGVRIDRSILQMISDGDQSKQECEDQFYQQMPKRMMLLANCYVRLGSPFTQLIGIIERITVIGAYELRLSTGISVDDLALSAHLSPVSRGALIEAQISILRRNLHKAHTEALLKDLLDGAAAVYQKQHPIRLIRVLITRIELGYYAGCSWPQAHSLVEQCLTLLAKKDLLSDTVIAGYRTQCHIQVLCWMQLHAHMSQKVDVIKEYANMALNSMELLADQATSVNTSALPEVTTKPLAQKSHSKTDRGSRQPRRLKPTKTARVAQEPSSRHISPPELLDFSDEFWYQMVHAKAHLELAHEYTRVGKLSLASVHYEQCLTIINKSDVSNPIRTLFLLRFARALAINGKVDKSKELYLEANELYSKDREDKEDVAQPIEKLRGKLREWRTASEACLTCAQIQTQCGNFPSTLRSYMQAVRLQKTAVDFIRRSTKVEEAQPVERNPFDMDDLSAALPDSQALHSSKDSSTIVNSSPRFEGWHWYFADGLLEATMATAMYHLSKGNHRDAAFFAQEARKLSEGIFSSPGIARSILVEIQISLHLGQLDLAYQSLTDAVDIISDHKHSLADSQRSWLLSSYYQRKGEYRQAEALLKAAENSLRNLDRLLGPTPIPNTTSSQPEADVVFPELMVSILGARAWIQRDSGYEDILVMLNSPGAQGPFGVAWDYSQARHSFYETFKSIRTDSSLGSFSESVFGVPVVHDVGTPGVSSTARTELVHRLEDTKDHCLSALAILPHQGSSIQCREIALKMVQVMVKLSAFGRVVETDAIATLFDLAISWTFHRDILDSIGGKFRTLQQNDDLDWPSWLGGSSAKSSKNGSRVLPFELDQSRSPGGEHIDLHWKEVERVILSRRYGADIQPLPSDKLPRHWTIVTISINEPKDSIILSRCRGDQQPLIFDIPLKRNTRGEHPQPATLSFDWVIQELNEIIEQSCQNGKRASEVIKANRDARAQWWSERSLLDTRMGRLLEDVEFCWLGGFKAALLDHVQLTEGAFTIIEGLFYQVFKRLMSRGGKSAFSRIIAPAIVQCFTQLSPGCRNEELEDIIYFVLDTYQLAGYSVSLSDIDIDEVIADFRRILREVRQIQVKDSVQEKTQHLFLVLDRNLQGIPWESIPALRGRPISRVPSMAFLFDSIKLATAQNAKENGVSLDIVDRVIVDPLRTFYVLNPEGDLKRTEEKFRPWAQQASKIGWSGIVGRKPAEFELAAALSRSDLFVYFGHGGAEQYIRGSTIRSLKRCAAVMLWGCSSGFMPDAGEFDRGGTPYNYLIGGCQSLIANLWDVTDKDIDRFAEAVFNELHLDAQGLKARNCDASVSVVEAVARARSVCKLPYLTGAAPVLASFDADCSEPNFSGHSVSTQTTPQAFLVVKLTYDMATPIASYDYPLVYTPAPILIDQPPQQDTEVDYLSNNRALLPEEQTVLRQLLESRRRQAAQLDAMVLEAAHAQNTLQEPYQDLKIYYESIRCSYLVAKDYIENLRKARDSMQPAIERLRSLLHPIRRYPQDILSLIFIAAVESDTSQDHSDTTEPKTLYPPRHRRRNTALEISQVCRAWRALAHATPETTALSNVVVKMWSTVRICLRKSSSAAPWLNLFSSNAKAVPMKVIVTHLQPAYFNRRKSTESDDEGSSPSLLDSVQRLYSLEINYSHFRALSCLSKLASNSKLHELNELTIQNDPGMLPTIPEFDLSTPLRYATNLRKLILVYFPDSLNEVVLPHFLAMFPFLQELVYFQMEVTIPESVVVMEMPHLQTIKTNFAGLSAIVACFSADRILSPDLHTITLTAEGQDPSIDLSSLFEANPSIRCLEMPGDFRPTLTVSPPNLFHHSSFLHTLILGKASLEFIELLSAPDETGTPLVLPNLKNLRITCGRPTTTVLTAETFENLYQSRCDVTTDSQLTSIGARPLSQLWFMTHDALQAGVRGAIEQRMTYIQHRQGARFLLYCWPDTQAREYTF